MRRLLMAVAGLMAGAAVAVVLSARKELPSDGVPPTAAGAEGRRTGS